MLVVADIDLPAHALRKIHQRLFACLIGIHLALRIVRCRIFMAPPVVQHFGHMHDAVLHGLCLFISLLLDEQAAHDPQNHIIVL